ncbi:hypothetical protein GCM10010470_17210 [Saccharopolyspora taberi]|uniref:Uncharacterized protein n=1 Tax=Saccharopolyspora taberi TaxID=60895 RepID=A0ABN3VAS7_9PSEU
MIAKITGTSTTAASFVVSDQFRHSVAAANLPAPPDAITSTLLSKRRGCGAAQGGGGAARAGEAWENGACVRSRNRRLERSGA